MVSIKLDKETLSRLGGLDSITEIRDETGRIVAYLSPVVDASVYASVDPGISEEDLDARSASGGGRPLKEILSDLRRQYGSET